MSAKARILPVGGGRGAGDEGAYMRGQAVISSRACDERRRSVKRGVVHRPLRELTSGIPRGDRPVDSPREFRAATSDITRAGSPGGCAPARATSPARSSTRGRLSVWFMAPERGRILAERDKAPRPQKDGG